MKRAKLSISHLGYPPPVHQHPELPLLAKFEWLSDSTAAVFSYPHSLAVGAEYEILQFLVVERTLLTLCSTV